MEYLFYKTNGKKRLEEHMYNIIKNIIKEAKWITADDNESWLEKMVWHKTPEGKENLVKVKSLPPKEQEQYRPKNEPKPEQLGISTPRPMLYSDNNYNEVSVDALLKNINNNLNRPHVNNEKISLVKKEVRKKPGFLSRKFARNLGFLHYL